MSVWLDRLSAALLDASLAATAITGLVVLAMLQCRQPAHRISWARAGLISTLALIPIAALNPVPRIDLRGPIRSLYLLATDNLSDGPELQEQESSIRSFDQRPENCPETVGSRTPPLQRFSRLVLVVYATGVTIALGWLALGLWGTSLLVRRSSAPTSDSLQLYESLPFSGMTTRPRLLVSKKMRRPVLVGSFGPVILIPNELDDPRFSDRLRLSLLHELAHVENLDHFYGPIALLTQTIWFFVPPFWWIYDQLKLDQEFLADRRAVSHFGTSGRYASSLVNLAQDHWIDPQERSEMAVVIPALPVPIVASALVQRVQMLLKCPFPIEASTPVWWRWSTALTLTLATLAASCLTLRGLGNWSEAVSTPADDTPYTFRLPQLVIAPRMQQEPFDIRYRLPDQFTLSLEVMAEPAELSQVEILGHKLGIPADQAPKLQVYRLWHRVLIRRIQGFEFVEVDGRSIPMDSHPTTLSRWLTIRPLPGQTTRIRELVLEWSH